MHCQISRRLLPRMRGGETSVRWTDEAIRAAPLLFGGCPSCQGCRQAACGVQRIPAASIFVGGRLLTS
eukprot:189459-Prymnesium_polylepis.1